MSNEVIERVPQQVAPAMPPIAGPLAMALQAMQAGMSIADMREMLELQKDWEANEARKAYVAAMAEFKKNPPTIYKDKAVGFESRDGSSKTEYMHATLSGVVDPTVAALAEHGFSHRWETLQADGLIQVTCVLTHSQGHSERTVLKAGSDTSGKKNSIQAIASTVTYLERYTLLAACGLATKDMDDDGQGADADDPTSGIQPMIDEALATRTDDDALAFWRAHNAELADKPVLYAQLKNAIARHRTNLQAAKANA